MDIKNEQVRGIFERWDGIWKNEELEERVRLKAYSILRILELVAYIYEEGEEVDEEDIDDLFIAWGPEVKPVFPEDMPALLERMRENLKDL